MIRSILVLRVHCWNEKAFAWGTVFGAAVQILGPEDRIEKMRQHISSVAASYGQTHRKEQLWLSTNTEKEVTMEPLYTAKTRSQIERVLSVFRDYIVTTNYFDILYSKKVGYI